MNKYFRLHDRVYRYDDTAPSPLPLNIGVPTLQCQCLRYADDTWYWTGYGTVWDYGNLKHYKRIPAYWKQRIIEANLRE